jgi:hypothetical protein
MDRWRIRGEIGGSLIDRRVLKRTGGRGPSAWYRSGGPAQMDLHICRESTLSTSRKCCHFSESLAALWGFH